VLSLAGDNHGKEYLLNRKRASLKLAQDAASPEARPIRCELADLYGLKATSAETLAIDLADALPPSIHTNRSKTASKDTDDA
jgi:hypothetical protein